MHFNVLHEIVSDDKNDYHKLVPLGDDPAIPKNICVEDMDLDVGVQSIKDILSIFLQKHSKDFVSNDNWSQDIEITLIKKHK